MKPSYLVLAVVLVALAALLGVLWNATDAAPESIEAAVSGAAPEGGAAPPEDVPPERVAAGEPGLAPAPVADAVPSPELEPEIEPAFVPPDDGFWVSGLVTDDRGFALEGATVSLSVRRLALGGSIQHGTTDALGRYALRLSVRKGRELESLQRDLLREVESSLRNVYRSRRSPSSPRNAEAMSYIDEAERTPPELCATATFAGPGFLPATACVTLAGELPHHVVLDLMIERGSLIHGVVQAAGGEFPVPGATVLMIDAEDSFVAGTRCDLAGRWVLPVREAGSFRLFGRAEGLGTDLIGPLTITPEIGGQVPDLSLSGAGVLTGRVSYPDGRATSGVQVELRHELSLLPGTTLGRAERALLEGDRGLVEARGTTDELGDFACTGLQPGTWSVRFPDLENEGLQPPQLFATGTTGLRFTYPGRHLEVNVVGSRSRALPVASCSRLDQGEQGGVDPVPIDRWTVDGPHLIPVEVWHDYLIRASAPGSTEDWTTTKVGQHSWRTLVTLTLYGERAEEAELERSEADRSFEGKLKLEVAGEWSGEEGWRATLVSSESDRKLRGVRDEAFGPQGRILSAPPGTYRLWVEPDERSGELIERSGELVDGWLLPYEHPEPITVRGRTETRVRLDPVVGGRVRVHVAMPAGDPLGEERLTKRYARERHKFEVQRPLAGGEAGGEDGTVWEEVMLVDPSSNELQSGAYLLPGGEATLWALLPPGPQLLAVLGTNDRRREIVVEVQSRRTVNISVEAFPRVE